MEACIKSPHADIVSVATPVTVPDPQVVTASVVDPDATALGGPDSTVDPSVNTAAAFGGKRKKSKSKRTRRRGRKTKRTRRRSRKTKRNKRKLKKRNSRKQ